MTLVARLEPTFDAARVFRRLATLPHAVFFDSADREASTGRYSFVAADPIRWWTSPAALAEVERIAALFPDDFRPNLPPFQGGVAGMFGYELGEEFETVPRAKIDEFALPTLAVGWYDVVVAFDHQQNAAWIISQGWPETDPHARHARAADRLAQFQSLLQGEAGSAGGMSQDNFKSGTAVPLTSLAPQHATGIDGLTSDFSADGYIAAVRRAIDYIHAGDVFQVNLSQRLLHAAEGTSVELYCRLRQRNPAPMAGYLDGGDWQILSASPERFLRVADRRVETRPIKGTAPRTREADADRVSGERLLASAKDRAENVMIVDLLRNDLSRDCEPSSIRVSQLCGLEQFAWVQHLVSVVEGTLRADRSSLDLVRHAFPGGSVTGAPKIRAMEIIAELEPTVRGPYCGSLGYLGVGGRMDTNILIRTITSAGGWWQIPVGGGIVADSDPERELEETWHKAKGMLAALRP
jgi:para-aminobenzoate synthetase component 1